MNRMKWNAQTSARKMANELNISDRFRVNRNPNPAKEDYERGFRAQTI